MSFWAMKSTGPRPVTVLPVSVAFALRVIVMPPFWYRSEVVLLIVPVAVVPV
jgi:hypothetical protein